MATIKETLQDFCYRMNLPAPSSFVGVTTPTERQYLSLLEFIGDNLRNRSFNWPELKRGYQFTTTTNQTRIQLPGDFYRILESSEWDVTNKWPLRGPISDYNYNVRQFAVVSLQTRKAFRIIGPRGYLYNTSPYSQRSAGWFQIDPAGQNNTDTLFLGYISANWIWPQDWAANTAYTSGNKRSCNGAMLVCTVSGTSDASSANRPNPDPDTSTTDITDGTVTWRVYREPYLCEPANSDLNDNDLVLFDKDLMIEGMRWAYKRAKGMDYQEERSAWEEMIKGAVARFNGPVRINMSDELQDYFEWPNIPQGSWNV